MREAGLTVHPLEGLDDVTQRHCFSVLGSEVGEDAGAEGDLLIEVAFAEAVMAELELWRVDVGEIGIENAEGIKLGDMVAAHLICADEQLNLGRSKKRPSTPCEGDT